MDGAQSTLRRLADFAIPGSKAGAGRRESEEEIAEMDVSVEIHCEACGSANYSLPEGAAEDAPILCNDCGADQGSVAALKAALIAHALDQSAESLRRGLGTLPDAQPIDPGAA